MKLTKSDWVKTKRIIKLFRPYKRQIIIAVFCMVASLGINMILPLLNKRLIDQGLLVQNFQVVTQIVLINFSLVLVSQGAGLLEARYFTYVNSLVRYRLTSMAFKQALHVTIDYYDETNPTEIMQKVGMDVGNISSVINESIIRLLSQVIRMMGGLVGLILLDWKLTLLVLGIIPIRYLLVNYFSNKRRELYLKLREYQRDYSKWYGDSINGVREIKLWGIDRVKIRQFSDKHRKMIDTNIKLQILDRLNRFSEMIFINFLINALYLLGALLMIGNSLTYGELFAFISYSSYVTTPISALLNMKYTFVKFFPSMDRFFEFLDQPKETAQTTGKRINLDWPVEGRLCFENVSFSYEKEQEVLREISFQVEPGEKVAIVGTNGSGKSTVLNLLLRLYKPDQGQIYLDGQDIYSLPLRDYRKLIAVVSQEVYLFNDTVRQNIAMYSNLSETILQQVTEVSKADGFIQKLPQSLDSSLGSNGARLSGGERQKISMARALARDAQILIFDEATSNYDIDSQQYFYEFLRTTAQKKTVLIITHDPEVLNHVDRVVWIDNGRVNQGKYQDSALA